LKINNSNYSKMKNIRNKILLESIESMVKNHISNIKEEQDKRETEGLYKDILKLIQNVRKNPNKIESEFIWDVFNSIDPLMVNADEESIINLLKEELGVEPNEYILRVVREKRKPTLLFTSRGMELVRSYPKSTKLITII